MKNILIVTEATKYNKFNTFYYPDFKVNLITPEEVLIEDIKFSIYDIVFLRTKNHKLLSRLKNKKNKAKIINPIDSIIDSLDRYKGLSLIAEQGIRVPIQFSQGDEATCSKLVVKNAIDELENNPVIISAEEWNKEYRNKESAYAQEYIDSKWEYKVYVFLDSCWCFRQIPTIFNADKMSTRERIYKDNCLCDLAIRAARAIGLVFASVDFLENDGDYYLTDINSTPGFQNMSKGYQNIMFDLNNYIDNS